MIPFNRPVLPDTAFAHMRSAIERQKLSGDGYFTQLCESWIEERLGIPRALLTTSCSSALEMAMLLINVGPGDEVIIPSFTFVSCANAVVLRGATPVFADIDPETLCISPTTIEERLTERTRAIMVVHYAGISRDIEAIATLAKDRGIHLIEDAAHAFLSTFAGRPLGAFGDLSTLSFHETKNFSMGEGGCLLVNNPELVDRAEIIREKGTNRKQFFQGLVDKYSWVDVGSSYVASDLLAALLWSQLEQADAVQQDRERSWRYYAETLVQWAAQNDIRLPIIPASCKSSFHMFQLILPSRSHREEFLNFLRFREIGGVFHYLPLESSPFGQQFVQSPCVNSEDISARLVRLPLFPFMSEAQLQEVVTAVIAYSIEPQ